MERRSASRANWQRILERRFEVVSVQDPAFTGYVSCLHIGRVRDPLYREVEGHTYCLADSGYRWMQHFPRGANHTITTMVNRRGSIVQWYIDICARLGVDADGVPWYEDLYLDIVVLPSRHAIVLDADELEAARSGGIVSEVEYDLAWREARMLLRLIAEGAMPILDLAGDHLRDYFIV